ncbi:uncharacterized protein EI97DRAFT_235036 [Westerdykella ornata]|uniref:Uncharacterized protein n=1 Tax=Westerdykella ornata TaxID=318751 RepID=A0A6A6J7K6_WESOR|nr:uncharacterized protein EI97DRAFT_235036 [Westerdykella ornata]KAF2272143.1 hypothetical protein EI97DRAFT_235036 [Westerdykella ornata]
MACFADLRMPQKLLMLYRMPGWKLTNKSGIWHLSGRIRQSPHSVSPPPHKVGREQQRELRLSGLRLTLIIRRKLARSLRTPKIGNWLDHSQQLLLDRKSYTVQDHRWELDNCLLSATTRSRRTIFTIRHRSRCGTGRFIIHNLTSVSQNRQSYIRVALSSIANS